MDLLSELQNRRVRRLLAAIDRLPRNSYFAEAVSGDREHMEMVVKAQGDKKVDPRPRLHTWSHEVEAITRVGDLLKVLIALTIQANSKKGAKKPDSTPAPRPGTVLDEVRREHRRAKHEDLVKRVLPGR